MIENGWAIYYSDHKINSAFATAYLKAEKEAQKKQKGIWADSAQNPLRDAAQLTSTDAGKILLVRGTVHDVHKRKDVIYLNFDDDWRRDFTIRVLPKNAKIFAKNGLDLDQLKGKKIEIRGYSEARNGIMIDWNSFWQVRVLAQD